MVKTTSVEVASYRRVRGMIEAWLEGRVTDNYIVGQILKAHNLEEAERVINDNESYFQMFGKSGRTIRGLKELLEEEADKYKRGAK